MRFVTAEPDALGLVDLAQVHVLATSTLRRLADEHPGGKLGPAADAAQHPGRRRRRMRDEDDWLGCDVHLGEQAVVHLVVPTPRCVMTTLAQPGLPKDAAVLKTIARFGLKGSSRFGQSACAGWYADIVTPGIVRRGDPIRVQRVQPRKGALAATIDV